MSAAHKCDALAVGTRRVPALTVRRDRGTALDELTALHRMMSAHIVQLEAHLERLPAGRLQSLVSSYVYTAMFLQDLLARVSDLPNVLSTTGPSFREVLAKATLWAYRWAVVQVGEVRHLFGAREAIGVRSVPLGALSLFHDLSELCASSGNVEAGHLVTLQAIDDALYRLIETRDRIEQHVLIVPLHAMRSP